MYFYFHISGCNKLDFLPIFKENLINIVIICVVSHCVHITKTCFIYYVYKLSNPQKTDESLMSTTKKEVSELTSFFHWFLISIMFTKTILRKFILNINCFIFLQ